MAFETTVFIYFKKSHLRTKKTFYTVSFQAISKATCFVRNPKRVYDSHTICSRCKPDIANRIIFLN